MLDAAIVVQPDAEDKAPRLNYRRAMTILLFSY